jgi:hypothetical protein
MDAQRREMNRTATTLELPESFDFGIVLETQSLLDMYHLIFPILEEAGVPAVIDWTMTFGDDDTPLKLGDIHEEITKLESAKGKKELPRSCVVRFLKNGGEELSAFVRQAYDTDTGKLLNTGHFSMDYIFGLLPKHQESLAFLQTGMRVFKAIAARAHVTRFTLRTGPSHGGNFAPDPPIARLDVYATLTTKAEVEAAYDNPDAFWESWDEIEPYGEKILVSRALDKVANLDFKGYVYPRQWAMARAAKPGLTKYYVPDPSLEEKEYFQQGEPRLQQVGYIASEQTLEFSCYVEPDEHIAPWEIYMLRHVVKKQAYGDKTVKTVQVSFPDREMAEREKRPLLDNGVKVIYYSNFGTVEELTEPGAMKMGVS